MSVYVKNLSTEKTPEKERAWLQKKNGNCIRQKNFIKKTLERQKEAVSVTGKAESNKAYALCFLPFLTFKNIMSGRNWF